MWHHVIWDLSFNKFCMSAFWTCNFLSYFLFRGKGYPWVISQSGNQSFCREYIRMSYFSSGEWTSTLNFNGNTKSEKEKQCDWLLMSRFNQSIRHFHHLQFFLNKNSKWSVTIQSRYGPPWRAWSWQERLDLLRWNWLISLALGLHLL